MSYVGIAAQLVTFLEQVTELQEVYNYEPKELLVYPCAIVTALGHRDAFADTVRNTRTFGFTVRLYFRTNSGNDEENAAQDAETILRDLADKVIAKVEANVTVASVWDIARPSEGRWFYQEREVPVRVCEFTVEIEKRVSR